MNTPIVRLWIALLLLATCFSGCRGRSSASAESPRSEYEKRLLATKTHYPFDEWQKGLAHGLTQYTAANCRAAAATFDRLIDDLIRLGEAASEQEKLEAFRKCVESLNELNDSLGLIETGEREQLCELCDIIAAAAGLDPKKYADGEGPASLWRDW